MKFLISILLTAVVISCSDEYAKTAHVDNLTELVSESKKALVYMHTFKKEKRPFYRDKHLLVHYYGGKKLPDLPSPRSRKSGCSAFFIDLADGYLATNYHCVVDTKRIDLELANGRVYRGEVIGADRNTDVALLRVSDVNFDRNGLWELKFAEQKPVQGDSVIVLGAPLALKGGSTTGSITSFNHPDNSRLSNFYFPEEFNGKFGEYIQYDALTQGGNSGGPLLNDKGQVIGIHFRGAYDVKGRYLYSKSAYAVSYTTVEHVIAQLRESGRVKWGDIGVSWQRLEIDLRKNLKIDDYPELPDYDTGAIITEATGSDLQAGDIVFAIGGKKITDHIDASNAVLFSTPGDSLEIRFIRDGKVIKKTVKVSLWHDPREVRPITKITNTGGWGLKVAEIDKGSLFYQTTKQDGLLVISDRNVVKEYSRAGCYLVDVDDQEISTIKQFGKYLKGKKEVVLRSLCFVGATKVFIYSTLRKKESVRGKKLSS